MAQSITTDMFLNYVDTAHLKVSEVCAGLINRMNGKQIKIESFSLEDFEMKELVLAYINSLDKMEAWEVGEILSGSEYGSQLMPLRLELVLKDLIGLKDLDRPKARRVLSSLIQRMNGKVMADSDDQQKEAKQVKNFGLMADVVEEKMKLVERCKYINNFKAPEARELLIMLMERSANTEDASLARELLLEIMDRRKCNPDVAADFFRHTLTVGKLSKCTPAVSHSVSANHDQSVHNNAVRRRRLESESDDENGRGKPLLELTGIELKGILARDLWRGGLMQEALFALRATYSGEMRELLEVESPGIIRCAK